MIADCRNVAIPSPGAQRFFVRGIVLSGIRG